MSSIQEQYQSIMKAKLANIKGLKEIEQADKTVKIVLEVMRGFYADSLDNKSEAELLEAGGKFLGCLANIGATATVKKAEHKASEQAYDELLSAMTVMNKSEDIGITEARSMAKDQLKEIGADIIVKEQLRGLYETILSATDRTTSLIQSAIKVRLSERAGNRFSNEV